MDFLGLVALADYNPRSALLGRALEAAGKLEWQVHFCFLAANGVAPPSSSWFVAARSFGHGRGC
jgi:hypothetical protein